MSSVEQYSTDATTSVGNRFLASRSVILMTCHSKHSSASTAGQDLASFPCCPEDPLDSPVATSSLAGTVLADVGGGLQDRPSLQKKMCPVHTQGLPQHAATSPKHRKSMGTSFPRSCLERSVHPSYPSSEPCRCLHRKDMQPPCSVQASSKSQSCSTRPNTSSNIRKLLAMYLCQDSFFGRPPNELEAPTSGHRRTLVRCSLFRPGVLSNLNHVTVRLRPVKNRRRSEALLEENDNLIPLSWVALFACRRHRKREREHASLWHRCPAGQ